MSTKPKVVIERVPKTVCPHDQPLQAPAKSKPTLTLVKGSKPKSVLPGPKAPSVPKTHNHPHRIDEDMLQVSSSFPQNIYMDTEDREDDDDEIPAYDEYQDFAPQQKQLPPSYYQYPQQPSGSFKNQDIPIFEASNSFIDSLDYFVYCRKLATVWMTTMLTPTMKSIRAMCSSMPTVSMTTSNISTTTIKMDTTQTSIPAADNP